MFNKLSFSRRETDLSKVISYYFSMTNVNYTVLNLQEIIDNHVDNQHSQLLPIMKVGNSVI